MKRLLEEDQIGGQTNSSTTLALKNSNQPKCLTLTDITEYIVKAKENDTEAQNHLMGIYYRGLYQDVLKPEKIGFLSWNNCKETIIQDDSYIFYAIRNYVDYKEQILNKFGDLFGIIQERALAQAASAQCWLGWVHENGLGVPPNLEEAARFYALAANQEFARAQFWLSRLHQNGLGGVEKNAQKAVHFCTLAANQGFIPAQAYLAWVHENGLGVPPNLEEAVRLYTLAADQGDAQAQTNLGQMHQKGLGVPKPNLEEAVRLYKLAADQGYALAQAIIGYMYEHGCGVLKKNLEEAVRFYTPAADQGHAHAQYNLGLMYKKGLGVPKPNLEEAVRLYKLAAAQGYAPAQCNLGFMHEEGLGVPKPDLEEAARLYKLAADQGYARAQCNLALMYEEGLGVPKPDLEEAARLYKLAADQGYARAQYNLGWVHEKGLGIPKPNLEEAMRLYKLAADQGNTYAQGRLADMYYNGCGTQQNSVEALRWWLKTKNPNAKLFFGYRPSFLQLHPESMEDEERFIKSTLKEMTKDLKSLVYTSHIMMAENISDAFFMHQSSTIDVMERELLEFTECLKAGCLMEGLCLINLQVGLGQQLQPHFISLDTIQGNRYTTIGENNVTNVQKVMEYLKKYLKASEGLEIIFKASKEKYENNLVKLMTKQLAANQTEEPLIIAEFKTLSQTVSQCEEEIKKIENERICFKKVNECVYSLIHKGSYQRGRKFLEDEIYSFLKVQ